MQHLVKAMPPPTDADSEFSLMSSPGYVEGNIFHGLTEVTENLQKSLAEGRLDDPVSAGAAFTPPSFPLSPPVSPECPNTIPPSFPLYDPAAYPAISPGQSSFGGHSVFPEYPTIAPPSFSLLSLNHSTSPECPAIAPTLFPPHYPVPPYPAIPPPSFPCRTGSSINQPCQRTCSCTTPYNNC
jgi:hypothetical protein